MQKQTIAVVLSGCGARDGSEIHEASLTLLALDRAGVKYHCLAPNISQTIVFDMAHNEERKQEQRNVLVESARIARGEIQDISQVAATNYAAMIFPGGYGAVLNLCNFGQDKENYQLQTDVLTFAQAMISAKKPAGFICIAPVLAAKLYIGRHVKITVGNHPETEKILEKLGAQPIICEATKCIVDQVNKVVSTPAYMLASSIKDVATGIECLVNELLALL